MGQRHPRREFLHADDLARACLHLLETYDDLQTINIGVGEDVTIRDLADTVADIVGYGGTTEWDTSKPDGTPSKLLDVSRIHETGWRAATTSRAGVSATYWWYLERQAALSSAS